MKNKLNKGAYIFGISNTSTAYVTINPPIINCMIIKTIKLINVFIVGFNLKTKEVFRYELNIINKIKLILYESK